MSLGLAFSLGGSKRDASGRVAASSTKQPKKPSTVNDLFAADSDDEDIGEQQAKKAKQQPTVGVVAPLDPEVKKAADKLAEFVARNGRSFEEVTRQRNQGDTPFKFLWDKSSAEYRYFDAQVRDQEQRLGKPQGPAGITASYEARPPAASQSWQAPSSSAAQRVPPERAAAQNALAAGDSVAAMNAYMKLAAKKDKPEEEDDQTPLEPLLNDNAFERRKVAAVFKDDGSRGHHMQDFIPKEELAKFLSKCGDERATEQAKALAKRMAIGADNIGHKLLSKMGWKEGQGIGTTGTGITAPVQAAGIKQDNLGLGAAPVHEVTSNDDAFEQYRKRMMLGYKYRPNPLGNPRKPYY